MSFLWIFNSIKSQAEPMKKGFMYFNVSIKGHKLNTLVDTEASNLFILENATTTLGLKLEMSK